MNHLVPVSAERNDPAGTQILRSLEDARGYIKDPILEIEKNDRGVHDMIRDCFDFVEHKLRQAREAREATRSEKHKEKPSWMLSPFNTTFANRYVRNIAAEDTPETSPLRLREPELEDPRVLEDVRKNKAVFQVLVEIFDKLSGNRWIKQAHKRQRLHTQFETLRTPRIVKAWYLLFPLILFYLSYGLQSIMLHVTTYVYIVHTHQEKNDKWDLAANLAGKYLSGNTSTFTEDNNLVILSDILALVPLIFCVLACASALWCESFNIGLWYKTMIVASLMAIIKGILDVATVIPDATGRKKCEERLSENGVKFFRELDFENRFWQTLFHLIWLEVQGGARNGGRIRHCANMMVSGHTYLSFVFSMSAYRQIAYNTTVLHGKLNKLIRYGVYKICIVCLCTEMLISAAAGLHYTVDMLVSIVIVLLLYDSRHIEQIAANWSEGYFWQDGETFKYKHRFLYGFQDKLALILFGDHPYRTKRIVPSQSTLFNYQRFVGLRIDDEPDSDIRDYSDNIYDDIYGRDWQDFDD